MINGIINIYKEKGYTSHDVVAKMRGILKQKKIGHTGTLDPDATGVLPVCLGCGTKLCDMLEDQSKEYIATMRLGINTDTQDITGEVIATSPTTHVTKEQVKETIASFKGEYYQIPPMYSAKKINGKKLYELARQGIEVERKPSLIFMDEIEILDMNLPDIKIRIVCSKGSYIRTLCFDIGEKLMVGGVMTSLVRTRAGQFAIDRAITLDELEEIRDQNKTMDYVFPPDAAFSSLRSVYVKKEYRKFIDNGNALFFKYLKNMEEFMIQPMMDKEKITVYNDENIFCALYEFQIEKECLKTIKMFQMETAKN